MGYTALYRKWRPKNFSEVKGQDVVVTTLKNQIKNGRIGHAYLFCGTRGTGKTSIAKILARAVNCENPIEGNPCGECESCKAIAADAAMNVVEIDAASNNGVDNIRQIREEVKYSPASGKFRVYIIDEVHMLSTGAFNALLKTLEEPPSYVIFILATTEAHKIPVTVLSRCQRYDFKRITVEIIKERLFEMVKTEQVTVEEKALTYIARKADGALRDAISLLDQCMAFFYGQELTYDRVLDVLGAVDNETFSRLLRLVMKADTVSSIRLIDDLVMEGRDLGQFVTEFIWYMRNLLLLKTADTKEEILDVSSEDMNRLKEECELADSDTLMRYIRVFSELLNQLRYATDKRVLLEIAVIKLMRPAMEQSLDSVLQRLSQVESKLEQGYTALPPGSADGGNTSLASSNSALQGMNTLPDASQSEKPQVVVLPKAQLEDLRLIQKEWGGIIRELGMTIRPALSKATLKPVDDHTLAIVFYEKETFAVGSRESVLEELKAYISRTYAKEIDFQANLVYDNEESPVEYVSEEELKSKIHMDIIVEEE